MSEILNIKTFFNSIQVHFSDIWLESCVNWCKNEVLNPNYTLKELQSKVYEQWLLLDLRDIEVRTLPPELSTKQHFVLNGNFCLQMMQVVDISKPKLWQLQKIRNSNSLTRGTQQDADVAGTGKRMLLLTLTDGMQEVQGMEYQPISSLNLNIAPGAKIRIMGPVVIRRGRLMLEQQNVKVLGGEVDELLVTHAAENILARALNLPENVHPVGIEEKLITVEHEDKDEGYVTNATIRNPQPPPVVRIVNTNTVITEEEEMLIDKEIDFMLEAEFGSPPEELNDSRTPDLLENTELFTRDFNNIDGASTSTQVHHAHSSIQEELPGCGDIDDDIFNDLDIDAHLDQVDKEIVGRKSSMKPNTITVAKLLEIKENVSKGVFKIKAKFKCVIEKLTISDEGYKLVIKVEDSTGDIVVSLHSDVISDLAGYSPTDIMCLKSDILNKDETAADKVMKVINLYSLCNHCLTIFF
jgi:hypothetical protein